MAARLRREITPELLAQHGPRRPPRRCTLSRRIRLVQYVVPSKAGFGWLCRNRSIKDVQPLDSACRNWIRKPKQASPDLCRLHGARAPLGLEVLGHSVSS
jgi:hypothetical protein